MAASIEKCQWKYEKTQTEFIIDTLLLDGLGRIEQE
jgi:hypothetical protein